ncbi:lipopolysaccharide biosynthesis protein [Kytococcus sp. Marseille-QA3725]
MTGKAGQALAGSLAFNLGQWALVVALSRWAGLEVMGQFAWALAVCTPVFMLTNLSMRVVALTDEDMDHRFPDYARLRLLCSVVGVGLVFLLALALGHLTLVVAMVAVAKALDAIGEVFYAWFQRQERFGPVALSQIANGFLTPLAVGAMLLGGVPAQIAVSGSVAASFSALAWLLVLAQKQGLGPLTLHFWKASPATSWRGLLLVAAPAGIASAVTSFLANIPRYAIEDILGSEALAVYSAISYIQIAGLTVVGAVATVLLPRLVSLRESGGIRAVVRATSIWAAGLLALTPVGAGVAWLLGAPVLRLLYEKDVFVDVPVLVWLVVSLGLAAVGWMFDLGLAARRLFRAQLYSTLLTVLVVVPLAWFLTARGGLTGAAVAAATAALVQAIIRLGFLVAVPSQRPVVGAP